MTTTQKNPPSIPGTAMLAGLVVAVVAVVGVSVFYWKHDLVVPRSTAPVTQAESAPPVDAPPTKVLDNTDGRFLFLLSSQGLHVSGARELAISDAHRVCSRLARGETEQQIVQDIFAGSPGMSTDTATSFADAAMSVYCPQG